MAFSNNNVPPLYQGGRGTHHFFYSTYKPINLEEFKNKQLLAIAGIGNPENFFNLIENNNLKINEKIIFPDHYNYTQKD